MLSAFRLCQKQIEKKKKVRVVYALGYRGSLNGLIVCQRSSRATPPLQLEIWLETTIGAPLSPGLSGLGGVQKGEGAFSPVLCGGGGPQIPGRSRQPHAGGAPMLAKLAAAPPSNALRDRGNTKAQWRPLTSARCGRDKVTSLQCPRSQWWGAGGAVPGGTGGEQGDPGEQGVGEGHGRASVWLVLGPHPSHASPQEAAPASHAEMPCTHTTHMRVNTDRDSGHDPASPPVPTQRCPAPELRC